MQDKKITNEGHQTSHLAYLLISLIFLLLFVPIFEQSWFATGLLRVGITAVLVAAAFATRHRRQWIILGIFVAGVAAPLSWMTMFIDQPVLFLSSCLLEAAFFAFVAVLILISVFRKHMATVESIFGAINGYMLLGLAWAVAYWGIAQLDGTSIDFAYRSKVDEVSTPAEIEPTGFSQFVYFSFVTMSTLGYGDITPRSPIVQTLAWMQSVTGQFYLAVLVAWLVSEIPRHKTDA